MHRVIFGSKSPNTISAYLGHVSRFLSWTSRYSFPFCPADPGHLAAYLYHISLRASTPSYPRQVAFAIAWLHRVTGVNRPCPTASPLVQCVLNHARLSKPAAIFQRVPLTSDQVISLIKFALQRKSDRLFNLRIATMIILAFSGFFRINELLTLKRHSIRFDATGVLIKIDSAKTDFNRQGQLVSISSSNGSICPVKLLGSWLSQSEIVGSNFLFPSFRHVKGRPVITTRPWSYDAARKELAELLNFLSLSPKVYGWHSFRSGGASTAINNGMEPRLVQGHGRWKSASSFERYVVDASARKNDVSKKLFA